MTALGALVFGGLLALGVLWLLVTAPADETQEAWDQSQPQEAGSVNAPNRRAATD